MTAPASSSTATPPLALDLDAWIEALRRCEPLPEQAVKALCGAAVELLVEEANVQRVDAPVTVCAFFFSTLAPSLSFASAPPRTLLTLISLPHTRTHNRRRHSRPVL